MGYVKVEKSTENHSRSGYEPGGRGFESCRARQIEQGLAETQALSFLRGDIHLTVMNRQFTNSAVYYCFDIFFNSASPSNLLVRYTSSVERQSFGGSSQPANPNASASRSMYTQSAILSLGV